MTLTPAQLAEPVPTLSEGLHFGIPDAAYFALPYMSSSVLRAGRETVAHMREAFLRPKEQTDSMALGSLEDTLVLEPERVAERFLIVPEIPKLNSNKGKAEYAAMEAEANGRTIVDAETFAAAEEMRDALMAHPQCRKWLSHEGHAQAVCVWCDKETGLMCKAKLDRFIAGVLALDLKTARSASPWMFAKSVGDLGYQMQAAWYLEGFEKVTGEKTPFGFAVVSNTRPHLAAAYTLSEQDMVMGHNSNHNLLRAFAAAQASGVWPGYSNEIEELVLPKWHQRVYGSSPVIADDGEHGF